MTPPEVLLKAARKAYPKAVWHWHEPLQLPVHDTSMLTLGFDIEEMAAQMALQIALEKEGWQFWWWNDEFYASQYETVDPKVKTANKKPDLLLAIVREGV